MRDITKQEGFIHMDDRIFPEYRQRVYNYLEMTLSNVMVTGDLEIIVMLIAELFGDLHARTGAMPWDINVDRCPDDQVQDLSTIIGYRWNTALTPDQQRESIKLFCLIRRWRGTNFGLANLIRVFGQDITSFYSSSDLRGVEIIEYGSGGSDTVEPNMFPGDIKIKIPELSTILRDSIFDTKLAGTRLIFTYYIFMGIYHMYIYPDWQVKITEWVTIINSGYDPIIEKYGPWFMETKIESVIQDQLNHAIVNGAPIASCQVLTYYKRPWQKGFIFNVPGLTNYRGFIEKDPTVQAEHVLYE